MKSVGNILKTARQRKKFTLEDVHKFIKIHPTFLKALEGGDYSVFSNKIHAKGFLKNYAEFLELDTSKLLALWRREYEAQFESAVNAPKKFNLAKLEPAKLILTPGLIITVISSLLIFGFFGYLFYQYRNYSGAPVLDIYNPQNSIIVNSEILDITGRTDLDSVLLINNQRVILDKDGTFATSLRLKPGLNTLSFLSVNKLGRETEEIRTIIFRELESSINDLEEAVEATLSEETKEETQKEDFLLP